MNNNPPQRPELQANVWDIIAASKARTAHGIRLTVAVALLIAGALIVLSNQIGIVEIRVGMLGMSIAPLLMGLGIALRYVADAADTRETERYMNEIVDVLENGEGHV